VSKKPIPAPSAAAYATSVRLVSDGKCFQDQVRDRIGMRDQRQVARLDLDRLRTHSLGHEAFQVGIDRPVLGGHGIEGRLGAPGGIRRLFRRQRFLEGLLNRVEDARLLRRQVAREVVQKSLLRQLAPIVIEDNAGRGRGVGYFFASAV
jgi:hypothetical protein